MVIIRNLTYGLFATTRIANTVFKPVKGKYEYVELEDLYPCPEEETPWKIYSNLRNDGGTMYGAANLTFGLPLDENMSVEFSVESSSPVGWQLLYSHESTDVCEEAVDKCPEIINELAKCNSQKMECPLPQGEYICNNFPLRYHFKGFEELIYGKFRGTLKFIVDDETKLCIGCLINVVPKEN